MVEITNFIGALLYFTGNLIVISYKNNEKDKINFYVSVINLFGSVFFVLNSFILFYRFLSGFDDLNVSKPSFMTIAYEINNIIDTITLKKYLTPISLLFIFDIKD